MAIGTAQLEKGSRESEETKEGYSLTRRYKILLDNIGDGDEFSVLGASGLPLYGEPHPTLTNATVKSRRASLQGDESDLQWIVAVRWDTKADKDDQQDPEESSNPLNQPGTFRCVSTNRDEIMVQDADGQPIVSSAGEPIRNITKEVADFSFVITKNLATTDMDFAKVAAQINQVNNAEFFGAPVGKCKLTRFECEYLWHPEPKNYFATSWEFAYREDGWDIEVLDEGFFELDANGDQKQIMIATIDADGNAGDPIPTTEPQMLDGAGNRNGSGADPVYLTFKRVSEVNFSDLNVPTALSEL